MSFEFFLQALIFASLGAEGTRAFEINLPHTHRVVIYQMLLKITIAR
jgi:hypothetical protein